MRLAPATGLLGWIAYAALAILLAWPWLSSPFLFSADQYMHGYNVCVLEDLLRDSDSFYASWLTVNTFPEPNLLGQAIHLLLRQGLSDPFAEKVLLLLLLGLNGYAFLGGWSRSAAPASRTLAQTALASLAACFWLSASWQLGFVNYLLGMALVLAALRNTAHNRTGCVRVLLWSALSYFAHPIALLFFLGTYSLRYLLEAADRKDSRWTDTLRHVTPRFLPALLLLVAYIFMHSEVSTWRGASPWRLLGLLYYHNDLTLFNPQEELAAKGIMLLTSVAVLIAAVRWRAWSKQSLQLSLVGIAVLVAAIVLAPDYLAGGALIHQRLMPFVFIWALWTLSSFALPAAIHVQLRRSVAASYFVFGLILVGSITSLTIERNRALGSVSEALVDFRGLIEAVPPQSTLLPVAGTGQFQTPFGLTPKPVMHHYAGVIDCGSEIVLLDNYEAFVGYFPLLWQPKHDPFAMLSRGIEAHPAKLDTAANDWLLSHVDYLVSYGPLDEALHAESLAMLRPHLRPIKESKRGTFALYKVNE